MGKRQHRTPPSPESISPRLRLQKPPLLTWKSPVICISEVSHHFYTLNLARDVARLIGLPEGGDTRERQSMGDYSFGPIRRGDPSRFHGTVSHRWVTKYCIVRHRSDRCCGLDLTTIGISLVLPLLFTSLSPVTKYYFHTARKRKASAYSGFFSPPSHTDPINGRMDT